jgi:hypothetical protein
MFVERVLLMTINHPIAACVGTVAMICYTVWPLFRHRTTMLAVCTANCLGFVGHYAILGQWTAATINGIMVVQTIVAIYLDGRPRLRWLYYLLMPVLAVGSFMTWRGLPSLLAGIAATLSTIGRAQKNQLMLRAWLLCPAPFWLVHDGVVGSLPGMIADLLSIMIGSVMLLTRSQQGNISPPGLPDAVLPSDPKLVGTIVGYSID